jgi:exoribonuclease II
MPNEPLSPPISPPDMACQLGRVDAHVSQASLWAEERFRRFPNLTTVSVQLGASFGLSFGVILTWNRPQ